ncbi:MAG TPA: hypothetical protein VI455_03035 [Terriglobia bacterium]
MDYHIVEARYVAGHVVWLRFRDGTSGEIDLAPALRGRLEEYISDCVEQLMRVVSARRTHIRTVA